MRASSRIFEAGRCRKAQLLRQACQPGISKGTTTTMPDHAPQQLLHLVIGGELIDLEHNTFKDLDQVEIVGVFPNYATAYVAWKAKAQSTVDNAQMRYFIVHLHRLLDPEQETKPSH
jgi:hypothetical protein